MICTLVMIPIIASAHTKLTSSNPAEGQVVKEELTEIVLMYAGNIESLSTMTLEKDGQEIPFISVKPKEKQMVGTLAAPLENGSYLIKWIIAGEDGHQIKGEIPFSVQMEQKLEQKTETKEPVTTEKEESKVVEQEQNVDDNTKEETAEPALMLNIIIPVVVLLILVVGVFLLFRRKK
jgi:copper resistance protein C